METKMNSFSKHQGCMLVRAQSCLTLCDPMDCSPPGSSVHRIFQTRRLEWVAISYSRGSFRRWYRTLSSCISCMCQAGSLSLEPPGKPKHPEARVPTQAYWTPQPLLLHPHNIRVLVNLVFKATLEFRRHTDDKTMWQHL